MAGNHITKNIVYIVVAVAIAAGILFYYQSTQTVSTQQAQVSVKPSISVSSQSLVGNEIVIDSLYLDKAGYVVIHKETDGKPGAVIGNSGLISGEKKNFKVAINATEAGTKVFAMLHYDNDNGVYEFPADDKPIVIDGSVLVKPVSIQQPVQTQQPSGGTVQGTVQTQAKEFTIEADDNKFKPSSVTVSKGDKVKITFKFLDSIYFGGLDVKSPAWITVEYRKGSGSTERSVEFTAASTFTFSSYWPASGVKKADGQVIVA